MKTKVMLLALVLSASTCLLTAQDTPPPADGQQPPAADHGPRGPRGGFHLLPPGAEQRLNLTDDQKTQIAALEADTKAKLEKILTPDQMKQLAKMHPPRGRGGPGGSGGGQEGGPGGSGGPGGDQGGPGPGAGSPGDNQQQPPPGN